MKSFIHMAAAMTLVAAASAFAAPAAGDDLDGVFDQLQRDMACLCGCNVTLKSCPHANCGYAVPARKTIRAMLGQGKTYDDVIAFFVQREGEVALSAPTKEGFNILGYLMPFLVLVIAGTGVAVTASRWARKGATASPRLPPDTGALPEAECLLANKLKQELEDFEK